MIFFSLKILFLFKNVLCSLLTQHYSLKDQEDLGITSVGLGLFRKILARFLQFLSDRE